MPHVDCEFEDIAIGRVIGHANDGLTLLLHLRNGDFLAATSSEPFDLDVGTIVLVREDHKRIELASPDIWPDPSFIGVVRHMDEDQTVLEVNGRSIIVRASATDYRVGDTVVSTELRGVTQVLTISDDEVAKFIVPKGPGMSFDDFGGLPSVVARARELIEFQLKHREQLSNIGVKPIRGVLFTGGPGTGKTHLARIIANVTDATFYLIRGPEIFSKWYGQSEELLRRIFDQAATRPSAIIFFDEIDSVASQRDSESHEATRRVVAQLLTLMDGFDTSKSNVVVIAATNRPQDVDGALKRPGRFDWVIQFPLPGPSDREAILRTSQRALRTVGEMPHDKVVALTENWSAAELTAVWTEAAVLAVADGRDAIIPEDYIGGVERVGPQRTSAAAFGRGEGSL